MKQYNDIDYSKLSDDELRAIAYGSNEKQENSNQREILEPQSKETSSNSRYSEFIQGLSDLSGGLTRGAYQNVRGIASLLGKNLEDRPFWGDDQSTTYGVGELVGKYAPQFIAASRALKMLPAAQRSSIFPQAGLFGLVGGALDPGTYPEKVERGLIDSILAASGMGLVKSSQQFSSSLGNLLDKILPSRYEKNLNRSLSELTGGIKPNRANDNLFIFNAINEKYRGNKQIAQEKYNNLKAEAKNKGYDSKKMISIDGLGENEKNILSVLDEMSYDKKSNEALEIFLKEPTFNNAHELQSFLGKRESKFKEINPELSKKIGEIKQTVKKNIYDSFNKYGDKDLSEKYRGITEWYQNNVVPYRATKSLRNISNSKPEKGRYKFPKNTLNALNENNSEVEKVVSDLNENARKALLAKLIRKKAGKDPWESLVESYEEIMSGPNRNLVKDSNIEKIEELIREGEKLKQFRNYIGNAAENAKGKYKKFFGLDK